MTLNHPPFSGFGPSGRTGVLGPEIDAEFEFESGEGGGVDPRLAIDSSTDDRTADPSASGNLPDPVLVGDGPEFDGEQPSDLGYRVGTPAIGPVLTETPGYWSDGARHVQIIRANDDKVLHSTNDDVTGPSYSVLSKQHYQEERGTVAERIERYTPQMPSDYWDAIGDFVRSCITNAQPSSRISAQRSLSPVTALVLWSWQLGYELDRRLIFDRMTIEEFIASGCPATWSSATRGNMRSQLFNISEALLGTEARIPRLNPLPPSNPSKPYHVKEIVTFRSWAMGQSTQSKRHDATALLALGAGAGLATEDLLTIHVSDVTLVDGFVIVNVTGRRPRQVPVLAEWEGDLLDVVRETTSGAFVFGQNRTTRQKNAVSNFLSKTTGTHKPNSQRLRATWIVHHLSVATPVKALLGAAGVESFEAFTRFIPFVPEVDPMEARHVLRGNKR